MNKKKEHTSHEEQEDLPIVNEPAAGYHTGNSASRTSLSSMPAQYSTEEFERYLDSFETT